ncbi:MAG: hypothetical protein HOV97_05765 [Nonomuraea sp.]|nr:hypothetical protein [Nonomuraea sp.]
MPGSEPKKKARKKAVEKAAEVMSGPAAEDVMASVHESINAVITSAPDGVPVLTGAVTVSLHLEYEDATTPLDAVNQACMELALNGLRAYTFLVRDEVTQMLYAVQNGKVVSLPGSED